MDLRLLMPMIAALSVFGMPVAIVFVNRFFKLEERERGLGGHREEKPTSRGSTISTRTGCSCS
jgi:hypothetical protein